MGQVDHREPVAAGLQRDIQPAVIPQAVYRAKQAAARIAVHAVVQLRLKGGLAPAVSPRYALRSPRPVHQAVGTAVKLVGALVDGEPQGTSPDAEQAAAQPARVGGQRRPRAAGIAGATGRQRNIYELAAVARKGQPRERSALTGEKRLRAMEIAQDHIRFSMHFLSFLPARAQTFQFSSVY